MFFFFKVTGKVQTNHDVHAALAEEVCVGVAVAWLEEFGRFRFADEALDLEGVEARVQREDVRFLLPFFGRAEQRDKLWIDLQISKVSTAASKSRLIVFASTRDAEKWC